MAPAIWKHSRRDAFPFGVSMLALALHAWLAVTWNARTPVERVALMPLAVLLYWYNGAIATHNFLHTAWFRHQLANRLYAAIDSVTLGVPVTICRFHHLNHHRYGNDPRGPDGKTRDRSSTYALGRNGRHAGLLPYCLTGLFRGGIGDAAREAIHKAPRDLALEVACCALALGGCLALSWRYLVFFALPVFYAGSCIGTLGNYYQHAGALGRDRRSNAVSYYGRLYNALLCNEGYHQEHHWRPQAHWTRRPELRRQLAGAARQVSAVPPVLGFLDRTRARALQGG